jgi:hypothetical protein
VSSDGGSDDRTMFREADGMGDELTGRAGTLAMRSVPLGDVGVSGMGGE